MTTDLKVIEAVELLDRVAGDKYGIGNIYADGALADILVSARHSHQRTMQNKDVVIHIPMDITEGRKVRMARKSAGLSQGSLASTLGFHQATVSGIENGHPQSEIALHKVCEHLGLVIVDTRI